MRYNFYGLQPTLNQTPTSLIYETRCMPIIKPIMQKNSASISVLSDCGIDLIIFYVLYRLENLYSLFLPRDAMRMA